MAKKKVNPVGMSFPAIPPKLHNGRQGHFGVWAVEWDFDRQAYVISICCAKARCELSAVDWCTDTPREALELWTIICKGVCVGCGKGLTEASRYHAYGQMFCYKCRDSVVARVGDKDIKDHARNVQEVLSQLGAGINA